MSYVGNTPTQQAFTPAIDYFSGNGSTTAFTLSRPVASAAQVEVIVNNVVQNPSTAYTVNGNTVTFTGAPSAGTNNIYVRYTSPITQVIQPSQASVGTLQLVDAAVTTAKIAAGQVLNLNGVAFPATQVPSADANTLDDYEEGTWTPIVNGQTQTGQIGYYVKIGRLVYVYGDITLTFTGSSSGQISGLPFFSAGNQSSGIVSYTNYATVAGFVFVASSTRIDVYNQQQTSAAFGSGARFVFSGFYQAA